MLFSVDCVSCLALFARKGERSKSMNQIHFFMMLVAGLHGEKQRATGCFSVFLLENSNSVAFRPNVHCNENPIYVFPEKELCGLSPNFHILSVSDLYIPRIGPHIFLQQNRQTDRGNIYCQGSGVLCAAQTFPPPWSKTRSKNDIRRHRSIRPTITNN